MERTIGVSLFLISITIITWWRIKWKLGSLVLRVKTPRKKLGLTFSIMAALISLGGLISLALKVYSFAKAPGGDFSWVIKYFAPELYLAGESFIVSLCGIALSVMEGQIREEGFYFGKIYTWDHFHCYSVNDCILKISTSKIKRSGKRKVVKLNLQERDPLIDMVRALEAHGIYSCESEMQGGVLPPRSGRNTDVLDEFIHG